MPKPQAKKSLSLSDLELRKWCIEKAIHWPTVYEDAYPGLQGHQQYYPVQQANQRRHTDVDLIGRATKILDWVQGTK